MNQDIKDIAFPTHLLKERSEIIEICLNTCRYVNSIQPIAAVKPQIGQIALIVDYMSRIFFFTEEKYYSIALPIQIEVIKKNNFKFKHTDTYITSEYWTWLIALHKNGKEILENDINFLDFLFNCESNNFDFYSLYDMFKETDYGYIRYDIDPTAYKDALKKGKVHSHPLNHFDIHLSNHSTFKTGLITQISPTEFIEYLDNGMDRWYSTEFKNLKRLPKS